MEYIYAIYLSIYILITDTYIYSNLLSPYNATSTYVFKNDSLTWDNHLCALPWEGHQSHSLLHSATCCLCVGLRSGGLSLHFGLLFGVILVQFTLGLHC